MENLHPQQRPPEHDCQDQCSDDQPSDPAEVGAEDRSESVGCSHQQQNHAGDHGAAECQQGDQPDGSQHSSLGQGPFDSIGLGRDEVGRMADQFGGEGLEVANKLGDAHVGGIAVGTGGGCDVEAVVAIHVPLAS